MKSSMQYLLQTAYSFYLQYVVGSLNLTLTLNLKIRDIFYLTKQ